MDVFLYQEYREFLRDWIKSCPNRGRGMLKKISEQLNVSSVYVTQIMKGDRELQPEQAYSLSVFLDLSEAERKYFLYLVQYSKSGLHTYKQYLKNEIDRLKKESLLLKKRLPQDAQLTEEVKAVFYSDWTYSAVRLLTSIDDFQTPEAIAQKLDVTRERVLGILNFLIEHGLCVYVQGKYQMGPRRLHLEAESPYVIQRQVQWRLKGMSEMGEKKASHLFFTAPLTISKKDQAEVRAILSKTIEEVSKVVSKTQAESLMCLNIDFFDVIE